MKIMINTALMGDKIINLLKEYKENGIEFEFIKKTGMKLEFQVNNSDEKSVISLVKTLIQNTEFGRVLYFSVEAV